MRICSHSIALNRFEKQDMLEKNFLFHSSLLKIDATDINSLHDYY